MILLLLLPRCHPNPTLHVVHFGDAVVLPDPQRVITVAAALDYPFVLDGEAVGEGEPLIAAEGCPFVEEAGRGDAFDDDREGTA